MIRGEVSEDQQALVTLEIIDAEGHSRPVEVILDTGFTGYLTLPAETIRQLGLAPVGRRTFELANGELFEFEAYLAAVSWHERLTDTLVLRSDSDPLLGMTLLWGSRVTLDAVARGEVSIEDLESEAPMETPDAQPIARGRFASLFGSVKRTLLKAAFVIAIVATIIAFANGVDSLTLNFGEIVTFMGIWLALGVILGQNKPQGTQIVPYLGRRIISFACAYLALTAIAIVYVVEKNGGGVDNIKGGELLGLLLLSLLGFVVGFFAGQDKDPKQ